MHLGLLERALFVEGIEENERRCYVLTPKGEAYLENVELTSDASGSPGNTNLE